MQHPHDERSCENCADYMARDPFGPDSQTMRIRADQFLGSIPPFPNGRYQGRGIVIAGGGNRFFPSVYVTVRALRHVGCTLPIQVWYLGHKREMPRQRQSLLAPFQVECVDADKVRRRHPTGPLNGWELKVFATLHCPFEEVLFLDADCYPCRNPEFLFDRKEYKVRGAIFWPDIMHVDERLKWPAFGVEDPRRLGSIESGQFVIDKRQCWQPLNLAWFYNENSGYYYQYCYGDKHTFEVAWTRCRQPFVMWQPRSFWKDVAFLQSGPDRQPLFVHRCRDKFRLEDHDYSTPQFRTLPGFYSSLPMETECWGWLNELAEATGRKAPVRGAVQVSIPSSQRSSQKPTITIATLYTPEIADYGEVATTSVAAYASRHGYQMLIARDSLDASRHPAWSKVLLVEQFLENNPDCEWLMWIDADAVITRPEKPLDEFIDSDVDFIVSDDPFSPINTGVFFLRNCPAALEMLRLAYTKVEYLNHPAWEQPALAKAMQECAGTLRTRVVNRHLFNSFTTEYKDGDFIRHFAGCPHAIKLKGVKDTVETAKQTLRKDALLKRSKGRKIRRQQTTGAR